MQKGESNYRTNLALFNAENPKQLIPHVKTEQPQIPALANIRPIPTPNPRAPSFPKL
jgi:hypothetical protein